MLTNLIGTYNYFNKYKGLAKLTQLAFACMLLIVLIFRSFKIDIITICVIY